ncbi:uncharacterized protein LOC111891736 isoform X2 [Lactuca sativa]|uniref:Uncharacterized protein n=1 Tax=Lactuca sativa TaxID=4236 RepID=A0A9R1VD66_LACSA|nr:uncharacterized protein LOC111891736 isoform X2 [Lactuca sativa]KAJ0203099.1 hypothetical protein LSAT_V11C500286510 [Lactuca sativa]
MGQTFGKEENKDIGPLVGKCYDKYFADPTKKWNSAEFYHAVCETVEEMNKMLGSTQFHVPKSSTLEQAYNKHHKGKEKSLSKDEFQKILQDIILDSGVTGMGIKDILLFIFGIPVITTFIKQRAAPNAVPNDVFIPAVTSASVFLLAKLNKI